MCTHLVEKECGIKYCVCKEHTALLVIQFSQCDISIDALLFLYILWYRIYVLTVVRIHSTVWIRIPCSLVRDYEYFGGAIWICLQRQLEEGSNMSRPKPQYQPVRLHGPITRETVIWNLNILRFNALYHYYKTMNTHIRQ
jgi:hypothetical protein